MEWPALPPGEIVLPETQTEERMMKIAVLGIDLGKARMCAVLLVWTDPVLWSYAGGSGGIRSSTWSQNCRVALSARRHVAAPIILVACSQLRDTTFD